MTLRDKIKHFLKTNGMTPAQLARKSEVPKQTLSAWMSGKQPRNISQVKKLSEVLGVSLDHLYDDTASPIEGSKQISGASIEKLLTEDHWTNGTFEIKIRRVKLIT